MTEWLKSQKRTFLMKIKRVSRKKKKIFLDGYQKGFKEEKKKSGNGGDGGMNILL